MTAKRTSKRTRSTYRTGRNHTGARRSTSIRAGRSRPDPSTPPWADWPDDKILDLRMCDLGLEVSGPLLERCIDQLYADMERRNIGFQPHFWLSSEWFTPDGSLGSAIPFYLAHPRLMRLERKMMFEAEGSTRESCLKIFRHELGHAVDHAYQFHRRRRWQQIFGKSSQTYPEFYQPKPYSKRFVLHLDYWYAQSHPDEDFAETFAVWMKPRSLWRKRYAGWPALKKLEYVDELMNEVAGRKPITGSRARHEPVHKIRKTLRQHYTERQSLYGREYPDFYDFDLRRLFSDRPDHNGNESAAAFLRRVGREIRQQVARWTGEYQYTLDLVLRDMIGRCRELKLRVASPEDQLKLDFSILLTVQTMNYLHTGRHRVGM